MQKCIRHAMPSQALDSICAEPAVKRAESRKGSTERILEIERVIPEPLLR